ncbi:hypothetical protein HCU40_18135 [Pseudanabaena biceps]|nr:hypothetical protein [Pseudanabaena biceps]
MSFPPRDRCFIYKALLAIALDDDKKRSPFVEIICAIAFTARVLLN